MLKRKADCKSMPSKKLKESFYTVDVEGDGNCFYRAVSVCLNHNENGFKKIKSAALKFLKENHAFLLDDFEADYIDRALDYHSNEGSWADELMILCTAHCYEIQIVIESSNYSKELCFLEECSRKIFLIHRNGNHFQAKISSELQTKKEKKIYSPNFSAKKNLSHNEKEGIKANRIESIDFVDFFGTADISRYNDVYKFLKEAKFPIHLLSKSAKARENWKYNVKDYLILDFPCLNHSRSRLMHFSSVDNAYYIIPLRDEESKIIESAHICNGKHLSFEKSIAKLYEGRIKYVGCTNKIRNFIEACAECNMKKCQKVKANKYTPIDTKRPRELILFDCVYLKEKLFGKNARLVTAIDHFSKFGWAEVIKSVNSENTAHLLAKVFKECQYSIESVLTDNGSEFKARFADFLKEKGIGHRKGAPYKPTTQGCVERFNKTIKQELKEALERNSELGLTEALKTIITDYNSWKHSSTGKKPIDLFDFTNEEDLDEVREYRNKRLKDNFRTKEKHLNLKENDNIIIRNDIIIEESSGIWYTKNEKTFGNDKMTKIFNIIGTVRAISNDHVLVQIKKDSSNFKKNNIIMVKENALKKVSDEAMKNLLKEG